MSSYSLKKSYFIYIALVPKDKQYQALYVKLNSKHNIKFQRRKHFKTLI